MGTGIYRSSASCKQALISVPCGYRDIPHPFTLATNGITRSLWVQGYTALINGSIYVKGAFPVGTGIYRYGVCSCNASRCVPCGYRDIPIFFTFFSIGFQRSLWVQGYTGFETIKKEFDPAFPVGTGIYRLFLSQSTNELKRSLWVQGYTASQNQSFNVNFAFPVGTGIYRVQHCVNFFRISVPCRYRDIPTVFSSFTVIKARSLWVQGYTVLVEQLTM